MATVFATGNVEVRDEKVFNFPGFGDFELSKDQLREELMRLARKGDRRLIDLLLGSMPSLAGLLAGRKLFSELARERAYEVARTAWHNSLSPSERQRVTDTSDGGRRVRAISEVVESQAADLFAGLVAPPTREELEAERLEHEAAILVAREIAENPFLPEFIQGKDEALAFRALMCGAGKATKGLLTTDLSPTQAYLHRCDELTTKVIEAVSEFLRTHHGMKDLKGQQASADTFNKVKRAVLGDAAFRLLYEFKHSRDFFNQADLDRLNGLFEDTAETPSNNSQPAQARQADPRYEELTQLLTKAGANEDAVASMARAVLKYADKKGLSLEAALTARAVNKQLEEAGIDKVDETAALYAQAAGMSEAELLELAAKKLDRLVQQAETDAAKAAKKQQGYKSPSPFVKSNKDDGGGKKGKKGKDNKK